MLTKKKIKEKNTSSHVTLTLFYSPEIVFAYKYLDLINQLRAKFKERIIFEPVVKTFASKSDSFMVHNCFSKGQFCLFEVGDDKKVNGKSLLLEGLSQICIYKTDVQMFFYYTQQFKSNCLKTFSDTCSKNIVNNSYLKWSDISKCVDGSFSGSEKDFYQNDNSVLASFKKKADSMQITSLPALFINDAKYSGSLAFSDLSMAVCELLTKEVQECHEIPLMDLDELDIVGLVIAMAICFILGLLILGVICKKIAKRNYLR